MSPEPRKRQGQRIPALRSNLSGRVKACLQGLGGCMKDRLQSPDGCPKIRLKPRGQFGGKGSFLNGQNRSGMNLRL